MAKEKFARLNRVKAAPQSPGNNKNQKWRPGRCGQPLLCCRAIQRHVWVREIVCSQPFGNEHSHFIIVAELRIEYPFLAGESNNAFHDRIGEIKLSPHL